MNFKRNVLSTDQLHTVTSELQRSLATLIDFNLQLKQAHWNLTGPNFVPVHEQLDELVAVYRDHEDEVAERILALGTPADGRAAVIAEQSVLKPFPNGKVSVEDVVKLVADRLHTLSQRLREAQEAVSDADAASEDLLIGVLRDVEKHLWMFQAQEG